MKMIICTFAFFMLVFCCCSCDSTLQNNVEKYPEYSLKLYDKAPAEIKNVDSSLTMDSLLKRDHIVLLEFTVTNDMYRETRYEYPDEAQLEGKFGEEKELLRSMLTTEYDYYYIPLSIESQSLYPETIKIDEIGVMAEAMIFADSVKIGSRFLTVASYYGEDSPMVIATNPRKLYYITDENTILPVCNETLLHDECIGLTVDEFKEYLTDMREKALAETDEVVECYD